MSAQKSYQRLLRTYPESWRRANGEIVLSTLLDLHARRGRNRPSLGDHAWFAVSGLLHRLPGRTRIPSRPLRLASAEPWHLFDQLNAVVDVSDRSAPGAGEIDRYRRNTASVSDASSAIVWGKSHI